MSWSGPISHAVANDRPANVARIAARLFPAYTVERGRIHLAGCTLEDRLLARLNCRQGGQNLEVYVDEHGRVLAGELVASLGLSSAGLEADARLAKLPAANAPALARFLESGLPAALEFLKGEAIELCSVDVLWWKFAEGKLRFSIGAASADLPFSGWAGTLQAPHWQCPVTGEATYHIAATDDGRIVAQQRLARCQESGRLCVDEELVTCVATGLRVASELTQMCPVSRQPVLARAMVVCPVCGEAVSPKAVAHGRCLACRKLQRVSKSDLRIGRLLEKRPDLAAWPFWRISETATVYIAVGSGWVRQTLLVVDKQSLSVRRQAEGNRLLPGWSVIDAELPDGAIAALHSTSPSPPADSCPNAAIPRLMIDPLIASVGVPQR